ncbi:sodium- and chloride-dependent GABA transporter ine isoform X2 [Atheta coriaria]|uniref:sodium- and chloride-dependent GABA transporter ine isoform X2 n=1 Tax=Dalotia coriaria TaxID=877792 RepID=UPI0031F3DA14
MVSKSNLHLFIRRCSKTVDSNGFLFPNIIKPPEEYLFEDSCDGSEDGHAAYLKPRRQQWSNKFQFVLACIGYSVGLGSVWRFPYLCYKSGGGVFLIPYFILLIICGVPMLYMELSIGQYTGRGPIGALGQLSPLFKGTGVASVVISFLMSTYYSVIIAYAIYYFFTSLKPIQPWAQCGHRWNTDQCWAPGGNFSNFENTSLTFNTPAEEFYNKKVLDISKGLEDFGTLRWDLVACLLSAWAIIYFAIWKSIKSSGKVRYFTATIPFLIIVILMGKSLTLEGAQNGMQYFFRPNWKLLGDSKVWVNAATQTFNSMGIAFGSMISFASYSKYHNNILHDTVAVSCVNALTSLLVGIFAFATIGNIAHESHTSIEDVIADGPGLIFVVFPQAMAKMPVPQFWASIFFFMLLCLALNSQFAIVEVVVTSVQDGFPVWIKKHLMCHEVLVFVVCIISFLLGLPNVTNGGIYFFQLIDHYAASISIMYVAFIEIIAISWFYGVWRLSKNIEHMTGKQPSLYFKFCWTIAAPLMIFAIWVFYMIDYESPTYNNGLYHYPDWAIGIGWVISSFSIFCLPIFMICSLVKAKGKTLREKVVASLKPNILLCEACNEHNCEHIDKWQECYERYEGDDATPAPSQPMLDIRTLSHNGIAGGGDARSRYNGSAPATPVSLRDSNTNTNDVHSNDSAHSAHSSKH